MNVKANGLSGSGRGSEKPLKVFVSQPMRDRKEEQILAEREKLLELVKATVGREVMEVPSYLKTMNQQMPRLYCLGASIQLLSDADVAVFAPGWEDARGCRIEHECAVQYGVKIVNVSGTL